MNIPPLGQPLAVRSTRWTFSASVLSSSRAFHELRFTIRVCLGCYDLVEESSLCGSSRGRWGHRNLDNGCAYLWLLVSNINLDNVL